MTADESVPAVVPARFAPTAEPERIAAIDAVRGLALLGIFLRQYSVIRSAIGRDVARIAARRVGLERNRRVLFREDLLREQIISALRDALRRRAGATSEPGGRSGPAISRTGSAANARAAFDGRRTCPLLVVRRHSLHVRRHRIRSLVLRAIAVLGRSPSLVSSASLLRSWRRAILTVFVIAAPEKSAAKTEPRPRHFDNPFQTWITALGDGKLQDPESPLWINTETQAYREGPYDQLFKFRAATWLMILAIRSRRIRLARRRDGLFRRGSLQGRHLRSGESTLAATATLDCRLLRVAALRDRAVLPALVARRARRCDCRDSRLSSADRFSVSAT